VTTTPRYSAGRHGREARLAPEVPTTATEVRRSTSVHGKADAILIIGAGVSALSMSAQFSTRVLPSVSLGGFVLVAYLFFLLLYGLLVFLRDDGRAVRDRLAFVVMHSLAVIALIALMLVTGFTFWQARGALAHLNFFISDMQLAGPLDPLTVGGIAHAALGTLIEIIIALLITVPLGLAGALYLNEARGALARFVRTIVEAMTALPSIVAGLFILASAILMLGLVKSGLAAGLAISVMMLPIIIRAADVVIRLVPASLREASLAVGASRWRTAWHVMLPTVRSGLTTAVLLGAARGLGETSPVLITAGFGSGLNPNLFSGPMVSLPLATFIFSRSPEKTMIARGFGAAAVLLAMVLVMFALARVLGGRPAGELSTRAQRKRVLRSQRDLARFTHREALRSHSGSSLAAEGAARFEVRAHPMIDLVPVGDFRPEPPEHSPQPSKAGRPDDRQLPAPLWDHRHEADEWPEHRVQRPPPVAAGSARRSWRHRGLTDQVVGLVAVLALSFLVELVLLGNQRHDRDQVRLEAQFRSELANATAPVGPLDDGRKPLAMGAPVAILEIPKLELREVVVEGTSSGTLMSGPGHRRDTPLPGQAGTSVIAGRRATYGAPFRSIDQLRAGDEVMVTTGQGKNFFKVSGVRRSGDLLPRALAPSQSRLTLITTAGPAFQPVDVLRVDATLVSGTEPRPAQLPTQTLSAAEALMVGDRSALLAVVVLSMLLMATAVATVWVGFNTGPTEAWVIGLPVLTALALTMFDEIAALLPNLL
jgi:phosphate transport system permease protein